MIFLHEDEVTNLICIGEQVIDCVSPKKRLACESLLLASKLIHVGVLNNLLGLSFYCKMKKDPNISYSETTDLYEDIPVIAFNLIFKIALLVSLNSKESCQSQDEDFLINSYNDAINDFILIKEELSLIEGEDDFY